MTSVLVTGAAGFVGSRLVEKLSSLGHSVTGVDCFLPDLYSSQMKKDRYETLNGLKGVTLREKDLRTDDLSDLGEAEIVIHQAAMPGLTKSWEDLKLYMDNNVLALDRVIQHASTGALKTLFRFLRPRCTDGQQTGQKTMPLIPSLRMVCRSSLPKNSGSRTVTTLGFHLLSFATSLSTGRGKGLIWRTTDS